MHAFDRFITAVQLGADLDRGSAERVAQAVLTTLSERLSGGQADDLAQQLKPPDGFLPGTATLRNRQAESFELDEFLRRVAGREQADEDAARAHTTVVLHALRLVVPSTEVEDAVAQLPADFAGLLSSPWRSQRPVSAGRDLVQLVTARGGPDGQEARRVTEGVLEVLAERLPDREVGALAQQLPDDLRPALERGRAARTAPRRLTAEAFLEVLAERLQTDPLQAREHARAVLSALVEVVDDALLAGLLTELPDDYADLLVPRRSPAGSG
ncbi:DUF2267 domain-containing protein [Geodermatophilus ruber]|uniref:Uncharacterized conserved protein, DUF2267 family n=1 Tax=Geodermatophilus ruber TaxID=504800 RepID=A0A1I4F925_9ACTN|nr:DUF2267 domain-containing protein [Geodermatophilus ruber]SFL14019.1 Uncharacterized conserved protein, DUF2267 family [Geodermatophilus ruber]